VFIFILSAFATFYPLNTEADMEGIL